MPSPFRHFTNGYKEGQKAIQKVTYKFCEDRIGQCDNDIERMMMIGRALDNFANDNLKNADDNLKKSFFGGK